MKCTKNNSGLPEFKKQKLMSIHSVQKGGKTWSRGEKDQIWNSWTTSKGSCKQQFFIGGKVKKRNTRLLYFFRAEKISWHKILFSTTFSHVVHRVIKQVEATLAGSLHKWTYMSLEETGRSTIILVIIFYHYFYHLYAGHILLYTVPSCNIRNSTQFSAARKKKTVPIR